MTITLDTLSWQTIVLAVGLGLTGIVLLLLLLYLLVEWQYANRPGNLFDIDKGDWQLSTYEPNHYQLRGDFVATNYTDGNDIFLTDVAVDFTLLSDKSTQSITKRTYILAKHPTGEPSRKDNYWEAYIVKARQSTGFEVIIDLRGDDLSSLQTLWLRLSYTVYGPEGRQERLRHCVLPLRFPPTTAAAPWRDTEVAEVLPVRTHLLTEYDDPLEVMRRYALPYAQPGDIFTIGESPLAIMQGRFRHPTDIDPGWLARRLCYFFLPTSSLATACGLQALVDEVGAWRVAIAFVLGGLLKVFLRIRGGFYMLAGYQARLIDDVTGTLPPYDQFIVMGPDDPQAVVDRLKAETGIDAAIVDANDLGAVTILAATSGVSPKVLTQALRTNPAGNAAEQTPIVLVRPKATSLSQA